MNKQVKVKAGKEGQVITPSKGNPDYGFIVVSQEKTVFEGGWARNIVRNAIISAEMAVLRGLGLSAGQTLPGKIVVTESLTPFNEKYPERDLKIAGDTKVPCTLDGQPIYRKTEYTEDLSAEDTLIQHNNTADIQAAYNELKAAEEASAAGSAEL